MDDIQKPFNNLLERICCLTLYLKGQLQMKGLRHG